MAATVKRTFGDKVCSDQQQSPVSLRRGANFNKMYHVAAAYERACACLHIGACDAPRITHAMACTSTPASARACVLARGPGPRAPRAASPTQSWASPRKQQSGAGKASRRSAWKHASTTGGGQHSRENYAARQQKKGGKHRVILRTIAAKDYQMRKTSETFAHRSSQKRLYHLRDQSRQGAKVRTKQRGTAGLLVSWAALGA
eukprot:3294952-Pleurochrysis_carterae.AAC.1